MAKKEKPNCFIVVRTDITALKSLEKEEVEELESFRARINLINKLQFSKKY